MRTWPSYSVPSIQYTGQTNGTCNNLGSLNPPKAGITGFVTLPENNASAVLAALAVVGPLAINVDASTWGPYEGGIFDGCSYCKIKCICPLPNVTFRMHPWPLSADMDIDHVVSLVGYGTDSSTVST